MRTSVTASDAMKKLVGCLICLSTTKLTSTSRFPKVVITMQMARLIAMKTVVRVPNGAGQHSGPHGVPKVPKTKGHILNLLFLRSNFSAACTGICIAMRFHIGIVSCLLLWTG